MTTVDLAARTYEEVLEKKKMKKNLTCLFLFALWTTLGANGRAEEPRSRPITKANTILAIYTEDWGLFSGGSPKLIVAVWEDGRVIWSKDTLHGGGALCQGSVAPQKVAALLKQLTVEKQFTDNSYQRSHFGPDSQFTTILVKAKSRKLALSSWHELEESEHLIATDVGLEPLGDRKREDVAKQFSPAYKRFRATWSSLRSRILALKPSERAPAVGKVRMRAGIMSWIEG